MEYIASSSRVSRYLRNGWAFYYYFNKANRNPAIRNFFFKLIRCFLPKGQVPVNVDADLNRLKTDGIVLWENRIDADTRERIYRYFADKPVFDIRDVEQTPLELGTIDTQQTKKLNYFPADIARSEDVVRIANDEKIISIVTRYFGCKPKITIMDAWWTKTGTQTSGPIFQDDMYHRDAEDFKFLKLFIYLNDVTTQNAPHSFIRGSHLYPKLTRRGPVSDTEAENAFDAKDRLILTGTAGTVFLEDTWGLHRSCPAMNGDRFVLIITYSMLPSSPYCPKKPVAPNDFGVDAYTNRAYLS